MNIDTPSRFLPLAQRVAFLLTLVGSVALVHAGGSPPDPNVPASATTTPAPATTPSDTAPAVTPPTEAAPTPPATTTDPPPVVAPPATPAVATPTPAPTATATPTAAPATAVKSTKTETPADKHWWVVFPILAAVAIVAVITASIVAFDAPGTSTAKMSSAVTFTDGYVHSGGGATLFRF